MLRRDSIRLSGLGRQPIEAEFYVIKGKWPALIGRQTAIKLVNQVDGVHDKYPECFKGIDKVTDYKLELHVDETVKPVAQGMYRVPYSM